MPTIDQLKELLDKDNCTWTWITQKGTNGYNVTSKKNGGSLFFPAAGYRYAGSIENAESAGYYWSRSLNAGYSDNASA